MKAKFFKCPLQNDFMVLSPLNLSMGGTDLIYLVVILINEPVAMKKNKTILTDERFHKIYVNDQLKEQTKSYRSNVVLKEVEK
jgi:hypothetical protein